MTTVALADQIACVRRELAALHDTIEIPLRGGLNMLIESRDLWVFTYWTWSIRRHRNTAYLFRREKGKGVHFHRELISAPEGVVVDHINGNGLDNRRSNLRLATRRQNNWNRAGQRDATSGFHGVSFHQKSGLWRARLRVGDAAEKATYHRTAEEAARARDEMAKAERGQFACLNFQQADREITTMIAVLATLQGLQREREPGLFG